MKLTTTGLDREGILKEKRLTIWSSGTILIEQIGGGMFQLYKQFFPMDKGDTGSISVVIIFFLKNSPILAGCVIN